MDFRAVIATSKHAAGSMPRWALPFYWLSALCMLFFAAFIWLIASFCMSMRPLYQSRR